MTLNKYIILVAVIGLTLVGSALSQAPSNTTSASTTPGGPTPTTTPTPNPTPTPASNTTCNYVKTKPSLPAQQYAFQKCIVAKFAAYFMVAPDQYVELKNGHVNNQSSCETTKDNVTFTSRLIVDFDCGQLDIEMGKNTSSVFVKAINGLYGASGLHFKNSTVLFETKSQDHYYKCNSEQSVLDDNKKVSLVLSNVALEAFRKQSGTDFNKIPDECALDSSQVSDLVRIGVGICLVALVALVLVAYFVGRRRWAERSSYESV